MKNILLISLLVLAAAFSRVKAQCTICTPVDCAIQKPAGGLCVPLPDDTAGTPYDAVVSFYMPHELRDPTTLAQCSGCSYVELRKIRIVGIQGLPTGVSATPNVGNGTYNVQAGDTVGCVTFCGTPVAPGTYIIVVNLEADVTARGIPVIGSVDRDGQAQTYRDTIEIFPSVSDCPQTFTIGSGPCILKACDSVAVNLNATLTNTYCPNLISYAWNYGNGGTSSQKTPGVINYTTPDTFQLSLTTTYYTYRVKDIYVNLKSGYCGDVEELTCGGFSPEPYLKIGSLGLNNRGNGVSANTTTFTNLNLVVAEAGCASPIEIQVWDEDNGSPFGSQDDNCGTHYITPAVPNQVLSSVTNSDVAVSFDTVAASSVTENIDVIVFPHPPIPAIVTAKDSMCAGDSTLIALDIPVPGYDIKWYLNDTTELASTDSAIYVSLPGSYTAKITNVVTGCTEFAAPKIIGVGTAPPPFLEIIFTGTQEFLNPLPSGDFSVDWYYNGNLVAGQNGGILPFYGNGAYYVEMYNTNYPQCRISAGPDTFAVSSIMDLTDNSIYGVKVFPNPNNGKFTLNFITEETQDITITLTNTIGQVVYNRNFAGFTGRFNQDLDLTDLSKGVYTATIETKYGKHNSRVVVQ